MITVREDRNGALVFSIKGMRISRGPWNEDAEDAPLILIDDQASRFMKKHNVILEVEGCHLEGMPTIQVSSSQTEASDALDRLRKFGLRTSDDDDIETKVAVLESRLAELIGVLASVLSGQFESRRTV